MYISHIFTYHDLDQDFLTCFVGLIYLALKFCFIFIFFRREGRIGLGVHWGFFCRMKWKRGLNWLEKKEGSFKFSMTSTHLFQGSFLSCFIAHFNFVLWTVTQNIGYKATVCRTGHKPVEAKSWCFADLSSSNFSCVMSELSFFMVHCSSFFLKHCNRVWIPAVWYCWLIALGTVF